MIGIVPQVKRQEIPGIENGATGNGHSGGDVKRRARRSGVRSGAAEAGFVPAERGSARQRMSFSPKAGVA